MQEPLDKLVDESGGQQMRPNQEGPRSAMEKHLQSWIGQAQNISRL